MKKYSLLRQRILETSTLPPENLCVPEPATDEQILLAHSQTYLDKVKYGLLNSKEIRRIGFPWSLQMVERSRRSVGGTISACRTALCEGVSANLAGGTHHAGIHHGEGYCIFNDTSVASRTIQHEGLAEQIAVIDCDVHQGNGTAAITNGDSSIYTFSIHGEKNFPFRKVMGNMDIGLPDNTTDGVFLETLEIAIERVLSLHQPDLVIYQSGADPYVGDKLGKLALTKAGLAQRDRLVMEMCSSEGIPVAVTMGGGYAEEVNDIVDIHLQTIQVAIDYAKRY